MRSLSDWEAYIQTLHRRSIDLELDRVRTVLQRLGGALSRCRVITVAGTNGKGSCVAMLEAILLAAGYRVGTYTSPHLVRYNERVRIQGEEASDEVLCDAFARVESVRGDVPLTYFEFGTLAAFEVFRAAGLDVLILEVGLGGRLDAVNVLDADCALVTSIGLDHRDWLGPDREHIGREKAGVMRGGRPAVSADPDPPDSLLRAAHDVGARLFCVDRDYGYRVDGGTWNWWGPERQRLSLPLPALRGVIQVANAAAVLMVLDALHRELPVDQGAIRAGLVSVRLAGRFQTLPGLPLRVLDVAHNREAAQELKRSLVHQQVGGRTLAVCGMLADKPVAEIFTVLADAIACWYLATLSVPRAARAQELAAALQLVAPSACTQLHDDPVSAYRAACADALPDDRVLVFGSFHTVGAIIDHLQDATTPTAA